MTITEAIAELTDALTDADLLVMPWGEGQRPAAHVINDGASELTRLSSVPWDFRVVALAGAWDADAAAADLAAVTAAILAVAYALDGWQLVSVSPSSITTIGGGLELTQDIALRRHIDITGG